MPSKKKKFNSRFPPARIKKIMQLDEEVGKVAAAVPVMLSRALEIFMENLLVQGSHVAGSRGARTLTASHLKQVIQSDPKLHFLNDLVAKVPDPQSGGGTGTDNHAGRSTSSSSSVPPTSTNGQLPVKERLDPNANAASPSAARGRKRKRLRDGKRRPRNFYCDANGAAENRYEDDDDDDVLDEDDDDDAVFRSNGSNGRTAGSQDSHPSSSSSTHRAVSFQLPAS